MQQSDDRSLKELLGDLTHSVTTLFRKEIELARADISEKFSEAGVAVGSLAGGAILHRDRDPHVMQSSAFVAGSHDAILGRWVLRR